MRPLRQRSWRPQWPSVPRSISQALRLRLLARLRRCRRSPARLSPELLPLLLPHQPRGSSNGSRFRPRRRIPVRRRRLRLPMSRHLPWLRRRLSSSSRCPRQRRLRSKGREWKDQAFPGDIPLCGGVLVVYNMEVHHIAWWFRGTLLHKRACLIAHRPLLAAI